MKYGFIIPSGDAHTFVDLAQAAEAAGWDGIFYWDGDWGHSPWVALAAMAMKTKRIHLGAVLSPLAWRRPWLFARETATLDFLSNGRLIVPVGLGAVHDGEWERGKTRTGEVVDRKERAAILDESLDIVRRLWRGETITHKSAHFDLRDVSMEPRPARPSGIPIWPVAAWPSRKSMNRALACEGLLPTKVDGDLTPDDLRRMREYVKHNRKSGTPFDIVYEGVTPGNDKAQAAEVVQPWLEAGATWWMESMWSEPNDTEDVRARIQQGPPASIG